MSEATRILFIVDVYNWAWGILTKTLSTLLPETYECRIISRDDFLQWKEFNPEEWSLILCYIYKNRRTLQRLDKRNTVIVIGSDPSTININSLQSVGDFRYFLSLNGKVYLHLQNLLPTKKHYFIMDGTDIHQFQPTDETNDIFKVGWVGASDRPLKRYDLAERAVAKTCAKFTPILGLNNPTYVPHESIHEYYQGLGCLLITSVYEVHSTVLYEAMACGVVPITTRTGDAEEFITDGVNGFLLDYDADEEQIASLIELLRVNPEKRKLMGEEARRTVVERLSWERVTPQYIEIFNRILRRGGVLGKRRVGILWWWSEQGADLSVIRVQREALNKMGVQVEVFNPNTVFENYDELERLNNCDLIFTSVMPIVANGNTRKKIKTPILFQLDGYGATSFYDGGMNPLIRQLPDMVDVVTFLDMNVYEEFSLNGFTPKPDDYIFIPNGINSIPKGEPTMRNNDEVLIGSLLKENPYKKPWVYLDSAKHNPAYRYLFPINGWDGFLAGTTDKLGWRARKWGSLLDFRHLDGELDTVEYRRDNPTDINRVRYVDIPNVEFIPHIDYDKIGDYIESCNVFTHYSGGDAFAKTVTELMSYGKAPLCSDVVRVQGISVDKLDVLKDCIGEDISLAYHKTRSLYRTGDGEHMKITPFNQPQRFAENTRYYVEHPHEYDAMGLNAKQWTDTFITWETKWSHIFRVTEDKGLI